MSSTISNLLLGSLDQYPAPKPGTLGTPHPELESISNYFGFIRKVAANWEDRVHGLAHSFKAPDTAVRLPKRTTEAMTKTDFKAWGQVLVVKPQGLSDNMMPFLIHLESELKVLADVHVRLYAPLSKYIQRQIAIPEEVDVLWSDRDIKLIDVDTMAKDLSSYFDKDVASKRGMEQDPVKELYSSSRDFIAVGDQLNRMAKLMESIDLRAINAGEVELNKNIQLYVKALSSGATVPPENTENIRRFEQTVYHAAKETEQLAVAIYFYLTAHNAYLESVELVEKALEV